MENLKTNMFEKQMEGNGYIDLFSSKSGQH